MKFLAALVLSGALVVAGAVPATAAERSSAGRDGRPHGPRRPCGGRRHHRREGRRRCAPRPPAQHRHPRDGRSPERGRVPGTRGVRLPARPAPGGDVRAAGARQDQARPVRPGAGGCVRRQRTGECRDRSRRTCGRPRHRRERRVLRARARGPEGGPDGELRGLYDESTPCTVPAQVAAVEQSAATLLAQPPAAGAGVESFDAYAGQLAAATAAAAAVTAVLATDLRDRHLLGLNAGRVRTLSTRVAAVQTSLDVRAGETVTGRASEVARIAAEQAAAAQAEAERVAAAAQAEAARAAKAAARKRTPAAPCSRTGCSCRSRTGAPLRRRSTTTPGAARTGRAARPSTRRASATRRSTASPRPRWADAPARVPSATIASRREPPDCSPLLTHIERHVTGKLGYMTGRAAGISVDFSHPIATVVPSAHGPILAVLARASEPLTGRTDRRPHRPARQPVADRQRSSRSS